MLSGETVNGDYPVQAVEFMASACVEAENYLVLCDKRFEEIIKENAVKRRQEARQEAP